MIRKIRMEKVGRSLGFKPLIGSGESSPARLFREATQLMTVATVVHVAGKEVLRAEVQEHAASPAKGGRPTVPAVADVRQSAQSPKIARVAEARGGVPGERGSRARGAYLVETTVSSLVMA